MRFRAASVSFSVALIVRNEGPKLYPAFEVDPGLLDRGGDVLVLDTGSTDDTVSVARQAGCRSSREMAASTRTSARSKLVGSGGDSNGMGQSGLAKSGQPLFHFGHARQAAGTLAKNDLFSSSTRATKSWRLT